MLTRKDIREEGDVLVRPRRIRRARAAIGLAALSMLVAPGCGGAQTLAKDPLGDAVTAYEITQAGAKRLIQRGGLTEVDINSAIVLEMDRDRLASHAEPFGARQEEIDRAFAEVSEVNRLVNELTQVAQKIAEMLRSPATPKEGALDDVRKLSGKVKDETTLLARGSGDPLPSPGSGGPSAYLVDKAQRSAARAELLASDERVRVRVEARVGSNEVHVPSYDSRNPGTPMVVKRQPSSTPPGPAPGAPITAAKKDREDIKDAAKAQAKNNNAVSPAILRDHAIVLAQQTLAMRRAATDALRASLGGVTKASDKVVELLNSPQGSAQTELKGAAAKAAEACRAALPDGSAAASAAALADGALAPQLANCELAIRALDGAQKPYRTANPTTELDNAVAELRKALSSSTSTFDCVKLALEQGSPKLSAERAEATTPPASQDRSARKPVNTTIDLLRADNRKEGELASYQLSLVADGQVVLEGAPVNLLLVRNGPQLRVAPAAFFVEPFKRIDGEPAFRPVPSVVASGHYRFGRGEGEARPSDLARAFNFVDPGVGIHMMTLGLGTVTSKTDAAGNIVETTAPNTFELGIGGTFQLFGDMLQVSGGYDLQAKRTYWAVGVGLQTLTDFGINWPPVERSTSSGN
jgi:hypothetical protein